MKARLVLVYALLVACSDAPTVPSSGAYFQLTLVNGKPLPTDEHGSHWTAVNLLLRGDKTFRLGLNNSSGAIVDGIYHLDGNSLDLVANGTTRKGEYFGDRAAYYVSTVFGQIQYVFDRMTPVPTSTIDGKFALTAVQGATQMPDGSFVLDTADESGRLVYRWLFDTLTFSEGMFVRRRSATLDSTFNPVAAHPTNLTEYGGFTVSGGTVTSNPYLFGRAPFALTLGAPGLTRADSARTFTYTAVP